MQRFEKGAEWRKWDLHVHTPLSILHNEFGNCWDSYVKQLFKKAIAADIKAIGITDYFLPRGYKKLHQEYLSNGTKMSQLFSDEELKYISQILILPNIEFRLDTFIEASCDTLEYNRKLNYHVIFSNEISIEKIESDFINQLRFDDDSKTGGKKNTKPLSEVNLEEFGKQLKKDNSGFQKYSDLVAGTMSAAVNEDLIIQVLENNKIFKGNYLLCLPSDEDLSKVNWNSSGYAARKNLIKQAQIIFATNPNTIQFFLGELSDNYKQEFGLLKPCVSSSDAHCFDELFKPALNRHTWIKADLTFKGLKQITFDPKSRVKIQEINPQQKSAYQVIKRVRFIDSPDKNIFPPEWIYLNPDLNAIIGGKSSGKSLLLYHIAKAANVEEVNNKVELVNSSYSYDDVLHTDYSDFEIEWENGDISRLSEQAKKGDDEQKEVHPITYIPQLYINHLAEKQGQGELNNLVEQVLRQNVEFDEFITTLKSRIKELSQKINADIEELYSYRSSYKNIREELSALGIEKSIVDEINKLNKAREELRKKSGFTEQEELLYNRKSAKLKFLNKKLSRFNDTNIFIEQFECFSKQHSNAISSEFSMSVLSHVEQPDFPFKRKFSGELAKQVNSAFHCFSEYLNSWKERVVKKKITLQQKIEDCEKTLIPLLKKVTSQAELEKLNERIEAEGKKLQIIQVKKKQALKIIERGKTARENLNESYKKLVDCYQQIVQEIEKPKYQLDESISIRAAIKFNEDIFQEFLGSFDKRQNLYQFMLAHQIYDKDGQFIFDVNKHANKVAELGLGLLGKEAPRLRQGVTEIELAKRLFANCFSIDYIISYKNDDMLKMSPGKKGLILLNLLLHLSNSSHPILIDQPEDNLDNRTIYEELNKFIRDVKFKRQIIMVTHNANLVVSADAECVIVANQSGQQIDLDNEKYRFEYCTGSLELSFDSPEKIGLLNKKGIREHVCEILEGGVNAFKEREMKYEFKN